MTNNFNEQDSLKVISEMISQARGNLQRGAGKYFILWGYIVVVACLFNFVANWFSLLYRHQGYIWIIACFFGFAATAAFVVKDRKKNIVRTYTDTVSTNIWSGFGCGAVIIGFVFNGSLGWYIYPAILFIYTFALFVSAAAYRFRWMYISVAISLICTLSYYFIDTSAYALPMAVGILCGNIIPGHILNKKAKKYV